MTHATHYVGDSPARLLDMAVALAQRLSLPLVTADEALVRRLHGTGLDVRWLGD